MAARTYIGGINRTNLPRYLTIGVLRRTGRTIEIGCRACNHVSEIAFAKLDLPAALPLSSAPRYLNCALCGASNSDSDQPIYLTEADWRTFTQSPIAPAICDPSQPGRRRPHRSPAEIRAAARRGRTTCEPRHREE
jgi:hypothetical protein